MRPLVSVWLLSLVQPMFEEEGTLPFLYLRFFYILYYFLAIPASLFISLLLFSRGKGPRSLLYLLIIR